MNTYGSGEEIYRRRIQYPTLLLPTINSTAYNIGGGGGTILHNTTLAVRVVEMLLYVNSYTNI